LPLTAFDSLRQPRPPKVAMGCQMSTRDLHYPHSPCKGKSIVEENSLCNFDIRSRYSHRPVEQDFIVENTQILGQGLSGVVTKARNRITNQECAVKVLSKKGLPKHRLDNLRDEVNNYLKIDHPHIARLLHVYEDDDRVCLVMELCSGKELFDRLIAKKQFSEREAQQAVYQMLLAITYLHKHNVVHCDLKLENFLYENDKSGANLKLIDFGFSKTWGHTGQMTHRQGTPSYTAPEVFAGNYTSMCDLWSLGVVVFLLLSGQPPFPMGDDYEAQKKIMKGEFKFNQERWKHISEQGMDFVKSLLVVDPDERMSADQCLDHPWLAHMDLERRSESSVPGSVTSGADLLGYLRTYSASCQMKRAAFTMMAHHLSSPALEDLKGMFLYLDTDRSGTITRENFRDALNDRNDSNLSEEEMWSLFDCVDVAGDGEIHYSEFIAAMLQSRVEIISDDLVRETFDLFDVSRTGYITCGDLAHVLGSNGFDQVDFNTLIAQCNGCNAKKGISYEQFEELLRGLNSPEAVHTRRQTSGGASFRPRVSSFFKKTRSLSDSIYSISTRSTSKAASERSRQSTPEPSPFSSI